MAFHKSGSGGFLVLPLFSSSTAPVLSPLAVRKEKTSFALSTDVSYARHISLACLLETYGFSIAHSFVVSLQEQIGARSDFTIPRIIIVAVAVPIHDADIVIIIRRRRPGIATVTSFPLK